MIKRTVLAGVVDVIEQIEDVSKIILRSGKGFVLYTNTDRDLTGRWIFAEETTDNEIGTRLQTLTDGHYTYIVNTTRKDVERMGREAYIANPSIVKGLTVIG